MCTFASYLDHLEVADASSYKWKNTTPANAFACVSIILFGRRWKSFRTELKYLRSGGVPFRGPFFIGSYFFSRFHRGVMDSQLERKYVIHEVGYSN